MARRRRRPNPQRDRRFVCSKCGEEKAEDLFVRDGTRRNGRFPWCKACVVQYRRDRPKRIVGEEGEKRCPVCLVGLEGTRGNRKYCSDSCKDKFKRLESYGLSPDDYRLLTKGGKCPICRRRVRRWEVDHNHTTGEVTGAVCRTCNGFLLAYTYHDAEIAANLAAYLKNPPVREILGGRRYAGPPSISQLHRMWAWNGEGNASSVE